LNIGEYKQDSQFINGMPNFSCVVQEHLKAHDSKMIHVRSVDGQDLQDVEFYNFPPGSAIALRYEIINIILMIMLVIMTIIMLMLILLIIIIVITV